MLKYLNPGTTPGSTPGEAIRKVNIHLENHPFAFRREFARAVAIDRNLHFHYPLRAHTRARLLARHITHAFAPTPGGTPGCIVKAKG